MTCDAWRDAAGKLWAPNMLAPIDAPQLKLAARNWLIGTVTYLRDESGQHARLACGRPEAFSVEPTSPNTLVTQDDVNNEQPDEAERRATPRRFSAVDAATVDRHEPPPIGSIAA